VTLVPLAAWLLPESPSFQSKSGIGPVDREVASPWSGVLRGRAGVATALFSVANFCGFMMAFGLNTWLPQLMRGAGYDLGSALQFQLVLNAGAVVGSVVGGWVADHIGSRKAATGMLLIAATSLGLLTIPSSALVSTLLVFIAGAAAGQSVLIGYVATHYRPESRATALGATQAIGRLGGAAGPLVGGVMVGAGMGLAGNVALFAVIAVVAAIAAVLVPRLEPVSRPSPDGAAVAVR
jgi:AAHS family benzoate transporter-like MFS transporter